MFQWLNRTKGSPRQSRPRTPPTVSVVLGSYDRTTFIERTVASIRRSVEPLESEIIIVDGGSTDGTLEWLIAQKDVITIVQHNRGEFRGRRLERRSWGYFMNLGFKAAQGEFILMLSDDCLLVPGAVDRGLERARALASEGRRIGGVAFYYRDWPHESDYYVQLTLGGKMMVNHGLLLRSAVEEIGWIDEDTYAFYKADGDLCLRLWRAGYEIVDAPGAFVEHYSDANPGVRKTNTAFLERDREAYLARWAGIFHDAGKADGPRRITAVFNDPDRTAEGFPSEGRESE